MRGSRPILPIKRLSHATAIALLASGLMFASSGATHAASTPDPSQLTTPVTLPPALGGRAETDGAQTRLQAAAAAAKDIPASADLTDRVIRETQSLDQTYPAQAPGAAASAGVPAWQLVGPTSVIHQRIDGYTGPTQIAASENGRVRKILVDPRDPNTVYVLFGAGGLWKTTNFNQQHPTWTPLTDRLHTVSSGSMAFGAAAGTIYLGLGDPFDLIGLNGVSSSIGGVMMKSTDGGLTWGNPVKLPGASRVNDLAVDAGASMDVVLVATDGGLFRSADGGATYSSLQHAPVDDPSTPFDDQLFFGTVAWSLARTSLGWVASAANGGEFDYGFGFLAFSLDHGATWKANINSVRRPYVGGSRATLSVGAPGDSVVYSFQGWMAPYEAFQKDVYRSDDGGLTWRALNTTTTAPVNPTPETPTVFVAFFQAWYNQLIWVDPTDPSHNTLFIGGDLYTARTTNGGRSWRMMTQWLGAYGLPYLHSDEHAAAFVPGSSPLLVVGNDGGLAVSPDGGATWSFDKNDGIAAAAIYGLASTPTNPNEVLIGTQDTGTLLRQGNTGIFNEDLGGDGMVPAIAQANGTVTFTTFDSGFIFRSTFDPQNQVFKRTLSRDFDPDAYFYTPLVAATAAADPAGQVFYTYTQHQVLRTMDAGLTWQPILSVPVTGPPVVRYSTMNMAVDPGSINGVVVGGYGGLVSVTHDGGANWAVHSLVGVGGFGGFNFTLGWAPNNTIYLGSETRAAGAVRVMRSTDGGTTWSAAAGHGLPDVPVVKLAPDLSDATGRTVYAGTWIGVFRTTDGGATWSLFGAGLPHVYVSDIYVAPDGSFVRVGTYGRGVWQATVG